MKHKVTVALQEMTRVNEIKAYLAICTSQHTVNQPCPLHLLQTFRVKPLFLVRLPGFHFYHFIMKSSDCLFCFRVRSGYVYAIVRSRFAIRYQYRVLHGWFYICHIQFCWLEFGFLTIPPS